MCNTVKQHGVAIRPGGVLTVKRSDGSYTQHVYGVKVRNKTVYNARKETLDLVWGRSPERVSIHLDGFYEKDHYIDGPYTVQGILVNDRVIIVTVNSDPAIVPMHSRMPLIA